MIDDPKAFLRHIIGFACATAASSLVAAIIFFIWIFATGLPENADGTSGAMEYHGWNFMLVPLMFLILAWVLALIIGLPLTLHWSRRKMEGPAIYSLSGFMVGALPGMSGMLSGHVGLTPLLLSLAAALSGGLPGAVCGYVWWRIARRPTLHPPSA